MFQELDFIYALIPILKREGQIKRGTKQNIYSPF